MQNERVDHQLLFESIYTHAPVGISLVSPEGIWLNVNPSLGSMLGYRPQELEGRVVLELTHPEDQRKDQAHMEALLEGSLALYETEKRYLHKNGEPIWVSVHVSLVRDGQGGAEGAPLYFISHVVNINDRKLAEKKLLETEELYQLISNHALDIISYLSPACIVRFCSPAVRDLLGREPEEVEGHPIEQYLHPDDLKLIRLSDIADEDALSLRFLHKNGMYVWFETRLKLIRDEHGRLQKILGISRDITERRKHDESLAEAQRIALLGSWEWDLRSETFLCSDQVYEILGLDRTMTLRHPTDLLPYVHGDERQYAVDMIESSLKGEPLSLEFRNVRADGQVKYLHLRGTATLNSEGQPILLHGTIQDITDRKRTELKLQETIERYTSLKKYNHDAVFSLTLDGHVINTNVAAQKLTGYAIEEMVGVDFSNYMTSGFLQEILRELKAANQNKHAVSLEDHIDQIRGKNGQEAEVLTTVAPIIIHDEIVGFYIIAKDITEQKNLLIAKEAAERTNKAKSEFLAIMSHEIRTPMNGVIGMTELLLNTGELDDEQREYVQLIQKSGDTLLNIINDILDFSKIESGTSKLQEEPLELRGLVAETFDLFTPMSIEKNLALRYSIDSDVPDEVIGDAVRLKQVITNLVGNALKFTHSGYVAMNVSVKKRRKNKLLLLFSVKDTGIGIPKEKLSHLFEPFQQLDNFLTRKTKGTGLGLAISKKLVELMGGEIWIEDSAEPGTTFSFTISLQAVQQEKRPAEEGAAEEDQPRRALHILVAEDNEINQLVLRKMLEKAGHRVKIAEDGNAVVQAAAYEPFDLIFMDIQMPGMNGLETTKAIQSMLPKDRRPVIVAVTANALKGDREKYLAAGMDDYLSKPIKGEALHEILNKHGYANKPAP
ncbi:hybrid sensor histidine kinase/response regulator [Paenibacillus sp. J31TS4]|uniref:PAS domain S-box protein n=1 Tax=Paenibacillus sp. J31TS4 TaxID=2807195 RepID=UPI001B142981|nr:PAS domain S-box protein [Paenibacillus sp. J31TS4]GIP39364.1 hybrid sensor histidine kinase/response regulator [Paenibacillus sp. J31TS4]